MRAISGTSLVLAAAFFANACAGTHETALLARLDERRVSYPAAFPAETTSEIDGSLAAYLAFALAQNPELRASFERFAANVYGVARARRLPEPTLSFGYLVRSAEAGAWSKRGRVGLQQAFPWPTKLTAGTDAASLRAEATERELLAMALAIKRRVTEAYFDLWSIRESRLWHREHLVVLQNISRATRARLAIGATDLGEQQQLDLATARLADDLASLDELERAAAAKLRATVALGEDIAVPTNEPPPPPALPTQRERELLALARAHPSIASAGLMAEAYEATARGAAAERLPDLSVGAEWFMNGEVMVGLGVSLPLWQRSYKSGIEAAHAEARAQHEEQRARADLAAAALTAALAEVRDTFRRRGLYDGELLPLARAAHASVLGAYTSGRGSIAAVLLAQRDLLELGSELVTIRAAHSKAWARLEELTGRTLDNEEDAHEP